MSPLSRPSRFRRIGLCVATGALAAVTAAAPALAADPDPAGQRTEAAAPKPSSDELSASALQREHEAQQKEARQEAGKETPAQQGQAKPQAPNRNYKGRVVASPELLLRDRPSRSSRVVGSVKYGTVVNIFCKTKGDDVNGNNRWYLLTDGTWAWGSARYIENIGTAPHWC